MTHDESSAFSTVPGTLISVPQLQDPNFVRSVVVMLVHNPSGALGVIINHATGHRCAEVVSQFELSWPHEEEDVLLLGGPVDRDGLWMIHDDSRIFDDSLVVTDALVTSRSRAALQGLCSEPSQRLLLGVGCAGWGPGQLERELAAGAWINGLLSPELLYEWPRDEVWERALRQLGIDPMMLVVGGGMQ